MNDIVNVIFDRIDKSVRISRSLFNLVGSDSDLETLARSFAADFSNEPNFEMIITEVIFRIYVVYFR